MQATSMEHIGRSGTGGLDPDQRAGHDTGQESLSKTFARNFPVYGRIADGWLLSSDFRPNDELLELRRSEEHTSELQSLMRISYAVFCLKKQRTTKTTKDLIRYNKP